MAKSRIPCPQTHCSGCPLEPFHGRRLPTEVHYLGVNADNGHPSIDILVVNEFPNQQESNMEMPLSTRGGTELKMHLHKFGLSDKVAYTNLVRCRPTDSEAKTREPTVEEMAACANHVWADIALLKPKVVLLLGALATRALVPYERWHNHSIHEIAGETYVHKGVTFFPIPNPYEWAFRDDVYVERKALHVMIRLLAEVVSERVTMLSAPGHAWMCNTEAHVKMVVNRLKALDPAKNSYDYAVGLDTETQNLSRIAPNGLSCIQFGPTFDMGYTIPLEHFDAPWTREQIASIRELLRWVFTTNELKIQAWTAHEAKFDLDKVLRWLDIKRFALPLIDSIFMEYLEDENMRAKGDSDGGNSVHKWPVNMKALLVRRCNFRGYDNEILTVRKQEEGFWKTPMNVPLYQGEDLRKAKMFNEYCGMDGYGAKRLLHAQRLEMDSRGYTRAYDFARLWGSRNTHTLRAIERNGIALDRGMLDFLQGPLSPITARIDEIPHEIAEFPEVEQANVRIQGSDKRTAGMVPLLAPKQSAELFNIRKGDHQRVLFLDVCKLEPVEDKKTLERTKKPPAMDRHFRTKHDYHPIVQLLSEHAGLFKLGTSYVEPMAKYLTDPKYPDNLADGRIHPQFSNTRTVTGRLACFGPSLQQIPRGDNFAKKCLKSLFSVKPGKIMMEADYGQAEVRIWAQLSGDMDFAQMFWNMYDISKEYERNPTPENAKRVKFECDVHRQVAALMFRKKIQDVTSHERQAAKSIVFGCIYGQTAKALGIILKIGEAEAAGLQQQFIGRFKQAGPWLTWIEEEAMRLGYVETPCGRRRHLGPLFQIDMEGTKRLARNSPIQAHASDIMAEAAYLQQCWIEDNDYELMVAIFNLVHDALYQELDYDFDFLTKLIEITNENMTKNVVTVLERDYGSKMIVPMVADFKIGTHMGHCYGYTPGEDLRPLFDALGQEIKRMDEGTPFYIIAAEQEKKKVAKEEAEIVAEIEKAQTRKDKMKYETRLVRHRGHMQHIENILASAA